MSTVIVSYNYSVYLYNKWYYSKQNYWLIKQVDITAILITSKHD
jgi:hypothetical protein